MAALLAAVALLRAGSHIWLTALVLPAYAVGWATAGHLWSYTEPTAAGRPLPTFISPIRAYILGLLILFLATGITHGRTGIIQLALPVYLLSGVATLAWLRSVGLHAAWQAEDATVQPEVDSNVRRMLGASVGVAAVVGLLVPLSLVLWLVAIGGFALSVGALFLFRPFLALLALTSFGIYHQAPIRNPPHTDEPWRYFAGRSGAASHPGSLDVLGLSFRGIVLLAAAYVIVAWYRHRCDGVPWRVALLQPLQAIWHFLSRLLGRYAGMALAHLPEPVAGLMPHAPSISRPWKQRALHRLSPREQVLAYYGAALTEARRRHLGRQVAETPLEYDAAVSPLLVTPQPALEGLTALFDLARYSTVPVPAEAASQARHAWQELRRGMRPGVPRDTAPGSGGASSASTRPGTGRPYSRDSE